MDPTTYFISFVRNLNLQYPFYVTTVLDLICQIIIQSTQLSLIIKQSQFTFPLYTVMYNFSPNDDLVGLNM